VIASYLVWLAPVLVFGLVVFVHELGHFLAAKAMGVYAPRFSIGFGPAIWAHRWGETEYRLAILPLGGYVRMASREDETAAMLEGGSESAPRADGGQAGGDPNAMMPFGPRPVPPDRWFESKSLPARLVIMFAGVAMNAVLTFAVLAGLALYYGRASASSAPVLDRVLSGSPAAAAGLASGDSVVRIAGQQVRTWSDLVARVSSSPGVSLPMTVMRHGVERTVTVVPRTVVDSAQQRGTVLRVGKIGAAPRLERHPMPVGQALGQAWTVTWEMAGTIVGALHQLATHASTWKSLEGPLGIAGASVEAARSGAEQLWVLIALLSINVAVFNLLPIPILDGGQVLVNVLEAVRGSPFSLQTREYILRVGLAAIVVLFVIVMYNDRCQVVSSLCSAR